MSSQNKKAGPDLAAAAVLEEARKIYNTRSRKPWLAAEDALRTAISTKDKKTERFWRKVFGVYAKMLAGPGNSNLAHLWNQASNYELGASNPPEPGQRPRLKVSKGKSGSPPKGWDNLPF